MSDADCGQRTLLSDDELRRLLLQINDPYSQDNLVWHIPPDVALVDILNTYAFARWPAEKVRCIQCDGRRHKHGFTALLSNASKALYGSKCGADVFGISWQQATNRFRETRARQTLLFRLDGLLPQIDEVIAGLEHSWRPSCDRLQATRRRFRKTMESLYSALQHAALREGGRLIVYEKVRDFRKEAEDARLNRTKQEPRYTWVDREVHVLRSGMYFAEIDPVLVTNKAIALLEEIQRAATDTRSVRTSRMKSMNQRLQATITELGKVAEMHRASFELFEPAELQLVANWATRSNQVVGQYVAEGSQIQRIDLEPRTVMALPNNYRSLDMKALNLLRQPARRQSAA